MRKETKIGILFFVLSIVLNKITKEFSVEVNILYFIIGACTGLSLVGIIIGMLPQNVYRKLKEWKKKYVLVYNKIL